MPGYDKYGYKMQAGGPMPPQQMGQAPMPMAGGVNMDPVAVFSQLPPDMQMMLIDMVMQSMQQPAAPAPVPGMAHGGEMQPGYAHGGKVHDDMQPGYMKGGQVGMEDLHDKIANLKAQLRQKEAEIKDRYGKKKT
tara:strand:+ start:833 stop:1237 length:405 start_codon:yes stop_codon:yes gene_type:complete